MNANEYNFEILNLWKSNFKSIKSETNLVPSFCSDLNTDGILFVGCSFTYSLKSIEGIKKKNNIDTPIFFRQYLDADIRQKQRIIQNAILLDSIVKNDTVLNSNISRYADLSISLNLQWEHINLFALRCFDGDETIKRAVKISNEYQNNDWQGWKIGVCSFNCVNGFLYFGILTFLP